MNKAKNKSIKMTDLEFERVKQGAMDRKLTIGKFIDLACTEYAERSDEISPEIICRLHTIKNLLNVSKDNWNAEMKAIFDTNVEELCVLLNW